MSRPAIDATHDPKRISWVAGAHGHVDFPIQNLPLGVFSHAGGEARIGVAIGNEILDLKSACAVDLIDPAFQAALGETALNACFALPAERRTTLRARCLLYTSPSPRDS